MLKIIKQSRKQKEDSSLNLFEFGEYINSSKRYRKPEVDISNIPEKELEVSECNGFHALTLYVLSKYRINFETAKYLMQDSWSGDMLPNLTNYFIETAEKNSARRLEGTVRKKFFAVGKNIRSILEEKEYISLFENILELMGEDIKGELEALRTSAIICRNVNIDNQVNLRNKEDVNILLLQALENIFNQYKVGKNGEIIEIDLKNHRKIVENLGDLTAFCLHVEGLKDGFYEDIHKYTFIEFAHEVFEAVASGNYRNWKYGDFDEMQKNKYLPAMDEAQYQVWQKNEQIEISNSGEMIEVVESIKFLVHRIMSLNDEKFIEYFECSDEEINKITSQYGMSIEEFHHFRRYGKNKYNKHEVLSITSDVEVENFKAEIDRLGLIKNLRKIKNADTAEIANGQILNANGNLVSKKVVDVLEFFVDSVEKNSYSESAVRALRERLVLYRDFLEKKKGVQVLNFTDDFESVLKVGAVPVSTCFNYENGEDIEKLAGFFEPSVKLITVENGKGNVTARVVLRLVEVYDYNKKKKVPILVLEEIYGDTDIKPVIIEYSKGLAERMSIKVYSDLSKYDSRRVEVMKQRGISGKSDVFGLID